MVHAEARSRGGASSPPAAPPPPLSSSVSVGAVRAPATGAAAPLGGGAAREAEKRLRFQLELKLALSTGSVCELTQADFKVVDFDFEGTIDRGARDEAKADVERRGGSAASATSP